MKPPTTLNIQYLVAVAVGIPLVGHWSSDLPLFPAMVLNVGGITVAYGVIRAGTRWLEWLRSEERRDPLAAWHRR